MDSLLRYQKGFTLLEIIATLVILSILAAIAVPRYINLDESARQKAVDAGVAELNGRETLVWSNIKISASGYQDDNGLWPQMNTDLGADYAWDGSPPDQSGGSLSFKAGTGVPLNRTGSTDINPGNWSR